MCMMQFDEGLETFGITISVGTQPAVFSTVGRGGGNARWGKCLEVNAGENVGKADIPWIRNDEGGRAVVNCAEASCFFVLGDTHNSYRKRCDDLQKSTVAAS